MVVGGGDGFEVFEPAAGFCGEEFEETAVEGEGLFDVGGGADAWGEGEVGVAGGGDGGGVHAGGDGEGGVGVDGLEDLVWGEDGAEAGEHFGEGAADAAEGGEGGGGAEGEFHGADAACDEGFGDWFGVVLAFEDEDGGDGFGPELGENGGFAVGHGWKVWCGEGRCHGKRGYERGEERVEERGEEMGGWFRHLRVGGVPGMTAGLWQN